MRVLLVTWTNKIAENISILNPKLEYCAIVTDDVNAAKNALDKSFSYLKNIVCPFYELKECLKYLYYDYVICLENGWGARALLNEVKRYDVSDNKIMHFCSLLFWNCNFSVEYSLRYFKEHAEEFDVFATGISYTMMGLEVTHFKQKVFNFGAPSQDLYYNLKTAQFAISCKEPSKNFQYALIGLAPYSFQFDESRASKNMFYMLQNYIAFKDLHNFHVSAEVYEQFFRKGYLSRRQIPKTYDINDPHFFKGRQRSSTPQDQLAARKRIDTWSDREFPETRAENVKILDDYLTLCESHNIRPIMFLPPMAEGYVRYYDRQRLAEFYYFVKEAKKKHPSAVFIDGWKFKSLKDTDFIDVDHLSTQGARKFSLFLSKIMENLESSPI